MHTRLPHDVPRRELRRLQQLHAELRQYYTELLTDEVRAGLAEGGEGGEACGPRWCARSARTAGSGR